MALMRGSATQLPCARSTERNSLAGKICFLCMIGTVFILVMGLRVLVQARDAPSTAAFGGRLARSSGSENCATASNTKWQTGKEQPLDRNHLPMELYQAVHENPALLKNAAVADAFLATPWLLPDVAATNELLTYRGLHNDLEALLQSRAMKVNGSEADGSSGKLESRGAVSVVYFSHSHAALMQNWVYTAVRWAGITNYIVATWEERSLSDCLAMHLPCFNATSYSPLPLNGLQEAAWRTKAFIPLSWVKPLVATDIVNRGYYVHSSDVDIAFPPKAFWPSMLRFLERSDADVAMERDLWGPVNTGCVVVRPTMYGKAFMNKWVERAEQDSLDGVDDQERAMQLVPDAFRTCSGPWDCSKMAAERSASEKAQHWALIRVYHSAWDAMYQDHCAGAYLDWLSPIDPCQVAHTNYHVVCVTGAENKIKGFKGAGLWFLDETTTNNCLEEPLSGLKRVSAEKAAAFAAAFTLPYGPSSRLSGVSSATVGKRRSLKKLQEQQQQQQAGGSLQQGEQQGEKPNGVTKCRPMHWRLPRHDDWFASCNRSQLAWVVYPPTKLGA